MRWSVFFVGMAGWRLWRAGVGVGGTIWPKVLFFPAIRDDSVFSVIFSRSKSVFAMIEVQIGIEIEDNLQIFWEI